jgi:hypothetical protein
MARFVVSQIDRIDIGCFLLFASAHAGRWALNLFVRNISRL